MRLENNTEEGRERQRLKGKKAVIGGVWCLSNTERLVMIPLAPHTETERHRQRERERRNQKERR